MISETDLRDKIVALANHHGAGKTFSPQELARDIAGTNEKEWRLLMKPIRAQAIKLVHDGIIAIIRRGKAVDPDNFKGVYKLTLLASEPAPADPT